MKGSTYDTDTIPQDNDSVIGIRNSPLSTVRFKLSALATYIAGKVPVGWQSITATLTYSSWDSTNKTGVISTSTDLTAVISVGMRLQITQSSTVKYFIITAISSTTITVFGGTDYTLTSATIGSPQYSALKAPYGFPVDPSKWAVTVTSSNDRTAAGTSYGSLTDAITTPIGAWYLSFKASIFYTIGSSTTPNGAVTLSSDGSTETNPKLTIASQWQGSSAAPSIGGGFLGRAKDLVTVATATTFTMLGKRSAGTYQVLGSTITPTTFRAICAYL